MATSVECNVGHHKLHQQKDPETCTTKNSWLAPRIENHGLPDSDSGSNGRKENRHSKSAIMVAENMIRNLPSSKANR